jgi:hypothetical protein
MAASSGSRTLLELGEDRQLTDLVKDWDFKKGRDFEDAIFANYKSSVHFLCSPRGAFHLLVVFRRYIFKLTDASVSMVIHSCLGGMPAGFHVQFQDCHYLISVASKRVGFAVSNLKRVTTPFIDVYFHLWCDGGENWTHELRKWQQEEASSWQLVTRRRSSKKVSFACILNQPSPIKKSSHPELKNRIKLGGFSFDIVDSSNSFPASFSNSNFKSIREPRAVIRLEGFSLVLKPVLSSLESS